MSALKLHKTYRYCISLVFLQLLLGWLFYTAFDSPETNLFEFTRIVNLWAIGIVLFSVLIFLEIKQFSKAWILPVGIILYYGSFLYIVYESYIFFRIPRVHSTNINYEIIPMYLTIPALFHALLDVIYKYFRPKGKRIENIQNLALSIIIPMFLYIFAMVIIPLFSGSNDPFLRLDMFVMKIGICIALTAFLFFFFRFILGSLVGKNLQRKSPLLIMLFGFIFPYLGLILSLEFNYFGDFNYPIIHVSIALNAIGLGLLLSKDIFLKLIGFLLAATGLPVVFYFFIVFLPYLPLSFVALVFAGAGFLLLTPIVLMILQYKIMSRQFASIAQKYTRKRVLILSFVCVSLVPIAFLGFCIDHKNYLNEIIAETDQFDASDRNYKDHDVEKLRYIFKKMQKDNQRLSVKHVQKRLPLLSVFYDWYVFDNLQISEQKKAEIERLFFGKEFFAWNNYNPPIQTNTSLTYTSNTEYIAKDDFYKTQIDLKITNIGNVAVGEFQSQFTLPKDVFITDYYLDIEGRRTHGILAEKKAANWVYNRVTARRIDPGILQYVYGNVLSLKIFPFGKDQTRTSGFTLYHRTPVHFSINDTPIAIEVHPLAQDIMELGTNSFYIPTKVKKELPKASLPVTYYFLVDNTTKGASFRKQFKEDFEMFSTEIQEEINVLYVDADVNWGTPTTPKESSFNYRKAIKQIQYLHRDQKRIPYVIVYAPYKNRLTGKYLSQEIDKAFPFDNLVECSHWNKKLPKTIELLTFSRNEQSYFIRNNDEPSLLNLDTTDDLAIHFAGNPYLKALQLRLFHDVNDLNPKRKKAYWLHALRESFTQHVLTHSTTFISLETKAQEETLLQFQEDIMNEDYTEKTGSETRRMSEPYFWLLLLVVIFMIGKQKLQDTKEAV